MKTALALQLVMKATDSALPCARRNRKRKQRWPVACSCCVQGGGKLAFAVSQHSPAQKKPLVCLGEVLRRRRHCGPTCASKVAGRRSGVQGPKFLRSHTYSHSCVNQEPLQRPLGCEIAPGRLLGAHPSQSCKVDSRPPTSRPGCCAQNPCMPVVIKRGSRHKETPTHCLACKPFVLAHVTQQVKHACRAQWECNKQPNLTQRLLTFTLQPYTTHCVPSVPSQLRP